MAEVFLADVINESGEVASVALKLMRETASREDFAGEADLMGLMHHPNLVERLEVGEAFGRPFIAMEHLMAGDLASLQHMLAQGGESLPPGVAFYVALEALKGLSYFHQLRTRSGTPLGLVHGDVNPANLFFSTDGQVKLGDFGVAKSRAMNLGPMDGVAAGKLSHLSPEQIRGEPLTPGSDLFSLGILLYELLTGRHPFIPAPAPKSPGAVMDLLRHGKLLTPNALPKALTQVIKRALHPDGDTRFQTAGEFAGELLHYALDAGALSGREEVGAWLQGVLGILS
jgi:serine/threonine-protein kinase